MVEVSAELDKKFLENEPTLLLGNGASIAISLSFQYKFLSELASEKSSDLRALFKALGTTNFEEVLGVLRHTSAISAQTGANTQKVDDLVAAVKTGLLEAVHTSHIDASVLNASASGTTPKAKIRAFCSKFSTILSFNYDLILYWSLVGEEPGETYRFVDCFVPSNFCEKRFRDRSPYRNRSTKQFFYPHGSLVLAKNKAGEEHKVAKASYATLQNAIQKAWNSGDEPLFVSEGTAAEKFASIRRSPYLRTVYDEVLCKVSGTVVAYGFTFAENDAHVIDALSRGKPKHLAISVWGASAADREVSASQIRGRIGTKLEKATISFFDANAPNCWCN